MHEIQKAQCSENKNRLTIVDILQKGTYRSYKLKRAMLKFTDIFNKEWRCPKTRYLKTTELPYNGIVIGSKREAA